VGVIQRGKMVLLLGGIFVVASHILQGVDSLEDIRRSKDAGDLDSGERTRAKHGVLSVNTLFVKVLGSVKDSAERVQKGIAHWDKQNNDVLAPNCMLKVQGEIIKDEGLC